MGMEDRDWYRDAWRKRESYTEKSGMRRSLGKPETRWYRQQPRGTDFRERKSGGNWWRAFVFFLAVYGAVSLLKDLHHRFSTPTGIYLPPAIISPR